MHLNTGTREVGVSRERSSPASELHTPCAESANPSSTGSSPPDEAFIRYPGPRRRPITSLLPPRIERNRPSMVIVEDDEEFRDELVGIAGLSGFTVWWFKDFDASTLTSKLEKRSRNIDVVHLDLHMPGNGSEHWITSNAILDLKNHLEGPRFGIASIYAETKVDEFDAVLPSKQPWDIDYFLGKPSDREDLHVQLTAILQAARLRELGRLVDNGRVLDASRSLDAESVAAIGMAQARLAEYLLPFDVSVEKDALQKYWSLLDHLDVAIKGRASGGLFNEASALAQTLILHEKRSLTTLYEMARQSIKSQSKTTALGPHEFEIEISMPRYVSRLSEFEVRISLPGIQQWDEQLPREKLNLVVVAVSDDFQIRDNIRTTGWPLRKQARELVIKAIPLRLGMRGIVFEFLLGATVVANAVCRTLVTTPELAGR